MFCTRICYAAKLPCRFLWAMNYMLLVATSNPCPKAIDPLADRDQPEPIVGRFGFASKNLPKDLLSMVVTYHQENRCNVALKLSPNYTWFVYLPLRYIKNSGDNIICNFLTIDLRLLTAPYHKGKMFHFGMDPSDT